MQKKYSIKEALSIDWKLKIFYYTLTHDLNFTYEDEERVRDYDLDLKIIDILGNPFWKTYDYVIVDTIKKSITLEKISKRVINPVNWNRNYILYNNYSLVSWK